jgi:hypothetical protein
LNGHGLTNFNQPVLVSFTWVFYSMILPISHTPTRMPMKMCLFFASLVLGSWSESCSRLFCLASLIALCAQWSYALREVLSSSNLSILI